TRLALARCPTKPLKGLEKERFDVMRLQSPSLGTLHLLAHTRNTARVHRVVRERPILEQTLQMLPIHTVLNRARKPRAHFRLVAVADLLDDQLAQRSTLKLELAQHVENLTAKCVARLLELLQQASVDVTLARLVGY